MRFLQELLIHLVIEVQAAQEVKALIEAKLAGQADSNYGNKPLGVHGRQSARERLRIRLTKRGVTLSSVVLAAVVTERTPSAAVAPALTASTLRAAVSLTATGTAAGIASTRQSR
jgi:hypothetical protein